MNRLKQITTHGQSIWLDYTKRSFVANGELRTLIRDDGVTGVTSNPAIFGEAINRGEEYDDALQDARRRNLSADEAYDEIVIADIQAVADELAGVFEQTQYRDGYVSLEVSPHLAHDTEGTIAQAHDLWNRVKRANLFIKVPGTEEGIPAIRQLIAEGINVNVTLLFGLPRYRAVAEAYLGGLEDRVRAGRPIERIASVASFFLSRIDVVVDSQLDGIAKRSPGLASWAQRLKGQAAIACAKQAYQMYKEIFTGQRFAQLAGHHPQPQRLLWASTSTKNPEERDVRYVEALIGPDTINTMPRQTLEAFRDHGQAEPQLEEDLEESRTVLRELGELGIDLQVISKQLEDDGVEKFNRPFDDVHGELARKLGKETTASVKP